VRETFNALGVTGGAPKFKQQAKSTRKPTSWERKALKAAKANDHEQPESHPKLAKVVPRDPHRQTAGRQFAAKANVKHPQRPSDPSSSSSSSSDDDSSDDASSGEDQSDIQSKSKAAPASSLSKTKKTKKEKIVSITFEHFPVEERDFHGISVSATSSLLFFTLLRSSSPFHLKQQGLLTNFLGGFEYHAGDLADLCVSVGGTVIASFSSALCVRVHPYAGWLSAEG
jgi:hypothetical protein